MTWKIVTRYDGAAIPASSASSEQSQAENSKNSGNSNPPVPSSKFPAGPPSTSPTTPPGPCPDCGGRWWWSQGGAPWVCGACSPPPASGPLETFTLAPGRSTAGPADQGCTTLEPAPTAPVDVHCGDCRHFLKDPIGDGTGVGCCAAGVRGALFPTQPRHCRQFQMRTPDD